MKFTKMHGLGNDYVYVNLFEENIDDPAALARIISDRHTGVGGDGLILITPSEIADARMRIFNADGSEAEMCGNGLRCVAKYTYEHGLASSRGSFALPGESPCGNASLALETGNGVLTVGLEVNEQGQVENVCVDMGEPKLRPSEIPATLEGETVIEYPIETPQGAWSMTCVSMGNPHAVIFVDNVDALPLSTMGPSIENHAFFPNRTNVHFVEIINPKELKIRTWERGSGITLACGTGACACAVAAILTKRADRTCIGHLPGGPLRLQWLASNNHVYMTGPAVEVFQGIWP
jgi:diaminopimelate epimerase